MLTKKNFWDVRLQDQIVSQVLAESHAEECRFCHSSTPSTPINDSNDRPLDHGGHRPRKPVALFTSGGMGAGKGHVLRRFLENGTIRLDDNFVWCAALQHKSSTEFTSS
jgi:hypothetical protein